MTCADRFVGGCCSRSLGCLSGEHKRVARIEITCESAVFAVSEQEGGEDPEVGML